MAKKLPVVRTPEQEKEHRMKMIFRYFNAEKRKIMYEQWMGPPNHINDYWKNELEKTNKTIADLITKYPYLLQLKQIYEQGQLSERLSNYRRPIQSP